MTDAAHNRGPVAPDNDCGRGGSALLILDMINSLDFDGAEALVGGAIGAAHAIARLRAAADANGLPVIYVNDNFDEWHSDRLALVKKMHDAGSLLAGIIDPRDGDYLITKPQFSGFYATNLPVLLPKLGVSRLILTGIAADICVLFTAADAHMRDYELWVPADCVAAENSSRHRWALETMSNAMAALTATTDRYSLERWQSRALKSRF